MIKFVEDFLSKKEIITEELCRQIGRPISQVAGELNGFKERADYMLSIAENKLADIDVTKDNNFKNFIRRKPLGVVFVIAPWNYPYLTAVNSIIPAMAAGNTVILKHSAQTPLCAEQLYKSAQKTLPKNVFTVSTIFGILVIPPTNTTSFISAALKPESFNAISAEFIINQMNSAIDKGAKKMIDENKFNYPKEHKNYLIPQVLTNVNHEMNFMIEETFGPCVGIMKVKDENEAINLMNDSPYGLTASIWTKDIEIAEKVGNEVQTGTFFMNRCDYLDPALSWTGVKETGKGCSLSEIAYEHLTKPKSFHLRKELK